MTAAGKLQPNQARGRLKFAAFAIVIAAALSSLSAVPAHAAWVTYFSGTLTSSWKWSGHHTNSGGYTTIEWPFSGTAYVMKSGSSATYGGTNYVRVAWTGGPAYVSVACALIGDIGGMPATCQTDT